MITLLWLIRSFQPTIKRIDSKTIWEEAWFEGAMLTILSILSDILLLILIAALI
jgi:hypothetical protein